MGDFYEAGIEIWAGLATFEASFFMFSWAIFFLNFLDGEIIFGIE